MCNCHSYNWDNWDSPDSGKEPSVLLSPPEKFGLNKEVICIDACIAHIVKHLWINNVLTYGSCCGHNRMKPSVIIGESATKEQADEVRSIIAQVDNREFVIHSWKLCEV